MLFSEYLNGDVASSLSVSTIDRSQLETLLSPTGESGGEVLVRKLVETGTQTWHEGKPKWQMSRLLRFILRSENGDFKGKRVGRRKRRV